MVIELRTDFAADRELYLQFEQQASEPYCQFVYDDPMQAADLHRRFFEAGVAEFGPEYGRLAVSEGVPVGMLACLPADALARFRLRSAVFLAKHLPADQRARIEARARLAAPTLIRCQPGDFYLSRIAVAAEQRAGGIGRQLVELYEGLGRQHDARRLVLEVSPVHAAAVRLYARCGFRELQRVSAATPDGSRRLEYAHLAKSLA